MTHIPSGRHTPSHLTDSEREHGRSREFASSDTNPQTMHTIIRYCSTNALSLPLKTCAPAKRRHVWFFGQHQHSAAPEFRIFAAFLPHPERQQAVTMARGETAILCRDHETHPHAANAGEDAANDQRLEDISPTLLAAKNGEYDEDRDPGELHVRGVWRQVRECQASSRKMETTSRTARGFAIANHTRYSATSLSTQDMSTLPA